MLKIAPAFTLLSLAALPARAEPVQVVTDIAPVHSLVSMVMGDIATPDIILPPGASPHHFSMRPSQAAALENADVVFWIGEALTPWLHEPIETLTTEASVIALTSVEGTILLEGVPHGDHGEHDDHDDHGDEDGHEEHEGEDGHDDHGDEDEHEEHEGEDGHDDHGDEDEHEEHEGEDEHDEHEEHAFIDPHAWLDPENAKVWLHEIARQLSSVDSENAAQYSANADQAVADLTAIQAKISGMFESFDHLDYITYHDAYAYYEQAFSIPALAHIFNQDEQNPSAADIAGLNALAAEHNVTCLLSNIPETSQGLVGNVFGDSEPVTAVASPIGAGIEQGPELYGKTLLSVAEALASCKE